MNQRTRLFTISLFAAVLIAPITLFAQGKLVLKSKTSDQCYQAKIKSDGSFSFENVKSGGYTLLIVGPKDYFLSKSSQPHAEMTLTNLRWIPAGNGAMHVSSITTPELTITPDMLIDPGYISCGEHKKEYSVLLSSKLETAGGATLSGNITNFITAGEKQAVLERAHN